MKPTFGWALCWLTLTLADLFGAADSKSAALDCSVLKLSLAGDQRIEVSSHRFSILPPQGESWCLSSSKSLGVTFFRIPPRIEGSETVPHQMNFLERSKQEASWGWLQPLYISEPISSRLMN